MKSSDFETHISWVVPAKILAEATKHPLVEPLYVTDIGLFGKAWNHYTERKSGCDQYILKYCTQGKGFVETRGVRRMITSNMILVIPPGVPHVYGAAKDDPWDVYWMHYTGRLASNFYSGPPDDVYIASVPSGRLPRLIQLFQDAFSVLARGFSLPNLVYTSLTIEHLLGSFFFMYANPQASGQQPSRAFEKNSQIVNQLILYLQNHITENISVSELMEQSGLSRSQLFQVFVEQTGYAPISFFIHLRMQRACRYLELTNMTIQDIAVIMGYNDPYYFSRLFTKTMGISPSAYRALKQQ